MFPEKRIFSFVSMAFPGDTFEVVSFTIDEGLNRFFRMELLLCSKERAIDFDEIIETPAGCILHTPTGNMPIQGLVGEFQQLHNSHGLTFYRAVIVPRMWWMTMGKHSQVFLDMTVPDILEAVLNQGGLDAPLYSFKLQHDYPVREMVCQYNESHYDFFMRWLEREGMYYYFQRRDSHSELVITDSSIAHTDLRRHNVVRYAPPSGLRHGMDTELVHGFVCSRKPVPSKVRLRDRNYQTPALDIAGMDPVHEAGLADSYEYGGHFLTPSEAARIARIKSEAARAHSIAFHGESSLHSIRGGFIFTLKNHFREDFNRDYLVISCRHHGNQASFLEAGVRRELKGLVEEGPAYENSFTAIPASMQYRPLPTAPWPRICGTLTATVDASGSGEYAELDEQGRYKVILPFDISGRKNGNASCWVRMMQPYGGPDHGQHFPLHKGAEVLLSFEGGDPDRPVIAGAVPNPAMPSPVTAADQTMCKITTAGQNRIHFEDKEGSKRILMSTPTCNTWLRLGAPNDPPTAAIGTEDEDDPGFTGWEENKEGALLSTEGNWYGIIGHSMEIKVGANSRAIIIGGEETFIGGYESSIVVGAKTEICLAAILEVEIGGKFAINLAVTNEIRPERLTLFEQRRNFSNIFTEIAESRHALNDRNIEINREKTRLDDALTTIAEHERQLFVSQEAIIENQDLIAKTRKRLVQDETSIRDNYLDLKQSHTALGESLIQMVDDRLSMMQQDIQMVESKIFV